MSGYVNGRPKTTIAVALAIASIIALIAGVIGAFAATRTKTLALNPGDQATITCSTKLSGTVGTTSATLSCAPATSTATATATSTPSNGAHPCGVSAVNWHPPVVNGCTTGHEHGDAPPSWVVNSPLKPMLDNGEAHTGYKGFLFSYQSSKGTVQVYAILHSISTPAARSHQYHNYMIWAKDPAGRVSYWQGMADFGDPATARFSRSKGDPGVRPAILVVDQASWDAGIRCEQWYGSTAAWSWDLGWTICNTTTLYTANERNTYSNTASWVRSPDGNLGLTRRLEASWYGPNSQYAPNRGNPPKDVVFCADPKSGAIVSCSTSGALPQYIASTMPAVEFPGNATQKTFPGRGVGFPN